MAERAKAALELINSQRRPGAVEDFLRGNWDDLDLADQAAIALAVDRNGIDRQSDLITELCRYRTREEGRGEMLALLRLEAIPTLPGFDAPDTDILPNPITLKRAGIRMALEYEIGIPDNRVIYSTRQSNIKKLAELLIANYPPARISNLINTLTDSQYYDFSTTRALLREKLVDQYLQSGQEGNARTIAFSSSPISKNILNLLFVYYFARAAEAQKQSKPEEAHAALVQAAQVLTLSDNFFEETVNLGLKLAQAGQYQQLFVLLNGISDAAPERKNLKKEILFSIILRSIDDSIVNHSGPIEDLIVAETFRIAEEIILASDDPLPLLHSVISGITYTESMRAEYDELDLSPRAELRRDQIAAFISRLGQPTLVAAGNEQLNGIYMAGFDPGI